MRYGVMMAIVGLLAGTAAAGVIVGGTESFSNGVNGGADWGVGGATAFDGWQSDKFQTLYNNNTHAETYGAVGQITRTNTDNGGQGISKGQAVTLNHSGTADTGSLAVQHIAIWSGMATAPNAPFTSNQLKYISFNGTAGVTYSLSGYVSTVLATLATGYDGKHPRLVDKEGNLTNHFADIQVGLKEGLIADTDLDATQSIVTGLSDNMAGGSPTNAWTPFTSASLTPTADGPVTIILHVKMGDISTGGKDSDGAMWDLDVRFDDLTLTPEPSSLLLLGAGLLLVRRKR